MAAVHTCQSDDGCKCRIIGRSHFDKPASAPQEPIWRPSGHFPFLSLPREIRDEVYDMLVEPFAEEGYFRHDRTVPMGLLNANHQIRDEFLDVFFDKAWVCTQYSIQPHHVQLSIPPVSLLGRVKHVYVRLALQEPRTEETIEREGDAKWDTVLADAVAYTNLFPKASCWIIHFRCDVRHTTRAAEWNRASEAWKKCALRELGTIRQVLFGLECRTPAYAETHTFTRVEDKGNVSGWKEDIAHANPF